MNVARTSTDIDLTGSVYGAKFGEIEIVSGISASGEGDWRNRLNTLNYFSIPSASSTNDYVMIASSSDGTLNYWVGDANFMATASYTYTINTTKPYVSGQQALVDIASAPTLGNGNVAIFRGGNLLPSLNSGNSKILYYFNSDIVSCYPESGSTIFNGAPSSSVKGSGSLINGTSWELNSGDSYFSLDGVDDYITVEKDNPLTVDYTIGARVYLNSTNDNQKFFSNWGDNSANNTPGANKRFSVATAPTTGITRLRYTSNGQTHGSKTGGSTMATNTWYDIALTYESSSATAKVYVDGTAVIDENITIWDTNDSSGIIAVIGAEGNTNTGAESDILVKSFFAVDSVLTADEITAMLSTGSV